MEAPVTRQTPQNASSLGQLLIPLPVIPALPQDLWVSIFGFLCNVRELGRIARVCRNWRKYCSHPRLWRNLDLTLRTTIGIKKTVLGMSMTLPMVQRLRAHDVRFTEDVADPLFRRLRSLRELDLLGSDIPTNAIALILTHCRNLEILCLARCKAKAGIDISNLAMHCPRIRVLSLAYLSFIVDDSVLHLARFPALESLSLQACYSLTDFAIPPLVQCTSLKVLDVRDCAIKSETLQLLSASVFVLHGPSSDAPPSPGPRSLHEMPFLMSLLI